MTIEWRGWHRCGHWAHLKRVRLLLAGPVRIFY